MNKAYALPQTEWPELDRAGRSEPNVDAQIDLMTALVRLRAKENGIAMQTLANHAELALVARGHADGADVMKGWRRAIIGEELLDLLEGRICLRLGDDGLVVRRCEDPVVL